MQGLNLKNMLTSFWSYNPCTPEEIETLELCKNNIKYNCLFYGGMGVLVTSAVSSRF